MAKALPGALPSGGLMAGGEPLPEAVPAPGDAVLPRPAKRTIVRPKGRPTAGDTTMTEGFDARAALNQLIQNARGWGAADVGFGDGSFYRSEADWRDGSPALDAWLSGDDSKRAGAVKEIGRSCATSEIIDLSAALTVVSEKSPQAIEEFRSHLGKVRERGEGDYPIQLRVKDAARLREILKQIEQAAGDKVRNGLHQKWPILTACLANAAPRHFVFLRPDTVTHARLRATIFAGISYEAGAKADLYGDYLTRSEALLAAMTEHPQVGAPPAGLSSVSVWWTAFGYLGSQDQTMRELRKLLTHGRHVILQGPPGTGKTHHAEQVAKSLAEQSKGDVVELVHFRPEAADTVGVVKHFVQFHASYDYEDFVRGFRPVASESGEVGFELRDGPFAQMVSFSLRFPRIRFLLVIDEINRADLARVLGECIYLLDRRCSHAPEKGTGQKGIEDVWHGRQAGAVAVRYQPQAPPHDFKEYSDAATPLARLCLPDNFYLVGTMNTADRSIAIVDVALRRRFAFMDVRPDPTTVRKNWGDKDKVALDMVNRWMGRLNGDTPLEGGSQPEALIRDPRYHIGHAYFMKPNIEELKSSVFYQVVPLLEEYRSDGRLRSDTPTEVSELIDEMRAFGGV